MRLAERTHKVTILVSPIIDYEYSCKVYEMRFNDKQVNTFRVFNIYSTLVYQYITKSVFKLELMPTKS